MTDESTTETPPEEVPPPEDSGTSKLKGKPRIGIEALAIIVALLVGGVVAKQIYESNAATTASSLRAGNIDYGRLQAATHSRVGNPAVYLGPFKLGKCGPEVRLMEGALRRAGVRKGPARNCMGPVTVKQVKIFQQKKRIKPVTGIYGLRTHKALSKYYSNRMKADLRYIVHIRYVEHVRETILIVTSHAYNLRGTMRYSQSGSRAYFPPWPRVPPATDCSGYVTWVLYQAGVGPSVGYYGRGSPVGWTGTLGSQGIAVKFNGPLHIGDLVFYGGGFPFGHVAIYIGHGLVSSHGSPGIRIVPYGYRPVSAIRRYF